MVGKLLDLCPRLPQNVRPLIWGTRTRAEIPMPKPADLRRRRIHLSYRSLKAASAVRVKGGFLSLIFTATGTFFPEVLGGRLVCFHVRKGDKTSQVVGRLSRTFSKTASYDTSNESGELKQHYTFQVEPVAIGSDMDSLRFHDDGFECNIDELRVLTVPASPFKIRNSSWSYPVSIGICSTRRAP